MTPVLRDLPASLLEALHRSRDWGFLGDGPIEVHVAHAQGFAEAEKWAVGQATPLDLTEGRPPPLSGPWMDLGSGGGIPGLILAQLWPDREATLLDGNVRRARFLSQVVEEQGWIDRVHVVTARAEAAGRLESLRGHFSLVVARSFSSPPVTAECSAPFLRLGGHLIVSEPPTDPDEVVPSDSPRWPEDGLATLGMSNLGPWRGEFGYRVLRQTQSCPERFPRRVGVPGKRPLFRIHPV